MQTPHRAPEMRADVVVPLVSACVTAGLVLGAPVAVLTLWPVDQTAAGLTGAFLGLTAVLWLNERGALRRTLWAIETRTGKYLDRNGVVGPEPHLAVAQPAAAQAAVDRHVRNTECDATKAALVEFVKLIYRKGSTAENVLRIKPANRAQYLAWRSILINDLHLAEWRVPGNERSGWTMRTDEATALGVIKHHAFEV